MCGIAGVLGPPAAGGAVLKMMEAQQTRGPDDRDLISFELPGGRTVTIGHTRLAIIDLTTGGHQPMTSPGMRWILSFNGEIYNYLELRQLAQARGWVFTGTSDSEVLLACWAIFGESILDSLNGMFAFCIVDTVTGCASLVRDRFGVKPCHFTLVRGGLAFASTPQALLDAYGPLPVCTDFIAHGLRTWAYDGQGGETAFQGIQSLPAGGLMRIDLAAVEPAPPEVRLWYNFEERARNLEGPPDVNSAATTARELIDNSISLRMRADVPVGLSLSGGLDSSIIACAASEGRDEAIEGFSFSLGSKDRETLAVERLASQLGPRRLHVTKVGPPPPGQMRETIEQALLCQGAPVAGLSALAQFQVFGAARREGIVVMLGGQGADESFMGYRKYQLAALKKALADRKCRDSLHRAAQLGRSLAAEGADIPHYIQAASRYRDRTGSRGLEQYFPTMPQLRIGPEPSAVQVEDVLRSGLPTLLRMEDRNSMVHSVESRHPFLDYRLVEFGAACGATFNVRNGYGKWILRKAFEHDLPETITWARFKRGFDPGTGLWLDRGLGHHLRSIIAYHRRPICEALELPQGAVVPDSYADARLSRSATAVHEALILCWVGLLQSRDRLIKR